MKLSSVQDPRRAWIAASQNLDVLSRRLEVFAENLANAETTGHKRVVSSERVDLVPAAGGRSTLVRGGQVKRDFSQGTLVENGDPRELALEGEGLFAVEKDGDIAFTRAVRVFVAEDGTLTDQRGLPLLGEGGPLEVPAGQEHLVTFDEDGTVQVDDAVLGKLSLTRFEDPDALEAVGPGLYHAGPAMVAEPSPDTRVRPGFRERSNVEPLREMVAMITLQRQFEATRRALDQSIQLSTDLSQSLRR